MAADLVLDSWEELDASGENSEASQAALDKLNSALERLKVAPKPAAPAKDPFAQRPKKSQVSSPSTQSTLSSKTSDLGSSGDEAKADKENKHIVLVKGHPVDQESLIQRLTADFGRCVRTKSVNDNNVLIVFPNTLNARHAVRSSSKYAPMKLYLIDEPEADEVLDYCDRHRLALRPQQPAVRPATNMSVIRQAVSRHLNVAVPVSADQRKAERDQLKEAKERKKAQMALFQS